MSEVVINVTKVEEVVTINATPNVTQILVNTNSGGGIQSVVAGTNITIDDTDPLNPIISASGGGGAVDSVNGQTGVVVLDADDISETATRFWLTNILKTTYDDAVTWITTNGTNILNHIASTSNPHNVTKSQVGLSNVVNADTTTTANITDSTNKRFVTDANLVVIGNTSGTNSGDNATNTTSNSYADAKVASELASFKTANFLDFTSSGQTQLNSKQSNAKLISANYTALNNDNLIVNATCTITDVTSPSNGTNYTATIVNGSVTIGGVVYETGVVVNRIYNSGAWSTLVINRVILTDISNTSTIVGFSSFNFKIIKEYDFGNGFVEVEYFLDGNSNSPTISFTLTHNNVSHQQKEVNVAVRNNGTVSNTNGSYVIGSNSNVVNFYQNNTEAAFAGSNLKTVRGKFIYYKG